MSSKFSENAKWRVSAYLSWTFNLLFADSLTSTLLDCLGYATGLSVLARLHSHIQLMPESLVEPVLSCGNDFGGNLPDELDEQEVVDKAGTTIATGLTCN